VSCFTLQRNCQSQILNKWAITVNSGRLRFIICKTHNASLYLLPFDCWKYSQVSGLLRCAVIGFPFVFKFSVSPHMLHITYYPSTFSQAMPSKCQNKNFQAFLSWHYYLTSLFLFVLYKLNIFYFVTTVKSSGNSIWDSHSGIEEDSKFSEMCMSCQGVHRHWHFF